MCGDAVLAKVIDFSTTMGEVWRKMYDLPNCKSWAWPIE